MQKNTYKTLAQPTPESLFKEKGSKFIGKAFPVTSEEMALEQLGQLWKEHPKASHICYAWQLGKSYEHYRINDDGEPTYSAGAPIYNQVQAFGLTQVLVTVVRYYGGTNLGVGGLKQAYKTTARQCLEQGKIVTRSIKDKIRLHFNYPQLHQVMRLIKEKNLIIEHQEMHLTCQLDLIVRRSILDQILKRIETIPDLRIAILKD